MALLFHGQRANEDVMLFTKQHPFVLFKPMLISVGFLLIPVLLYSLTTSNQILSIVFPICLIIALVRGGLAWMGWNNSVVLVTTERVVMLNQKGILNRELVECGLTTINQVSHEVKGLLNTLLGFGSLSVYTSGSQIPLYAANIPDPYDVQQEILRIAAGEGFMEEEEGN